MQTKKVISILLIQIFSIFLLTACGGSGSSNGDPTIAEGISFNIPENAAVNSPVGTVTATDPDGDPLTYSIIESVPKDAAAKVAPSGIFKINATTGEITVAQKHSFTPKESLTITVEAKDDSEATGTATITINIDDVNLTASFPTSITVGTSLNVGAPLGSADDGLTYSIVGGNTNEAFAIDPKTGQITIIDPSAVHPGDTFQLQIQATDGTLTDVVTIAIAIPSTSIIPAGLSTITIPEIDKGDIKNGAVIATLGAFDGITYSIVGFDANSPFAIDPVTGEITVNNSAAVQIGENILEILVSNGVVSEILTLTITVSDTSLLPDGHSLSGNNPTVTIGTPLGSADDGLTYAIVGGTHADSFTIDPETGLISVNDGANLGSGSYTLEISVTTEGGFTETVTVTVTQESLIPADLANNPTVTIGTPLGSADDGLTYTITGGTDAGSFTIDSQTGQISVNDGANLVSGSYDLVIGISNGSFTDTIAVTVVINAPVISFTPTKDFLLRRAAAGTEVGTIAVDLRDATSITTRALNTSGTTGASPEFEIVGDKVVLKSGVTLAEDSYVLDIIYSSAALVSNTEKFTINIVNDFAGRQAKIIPFGDSVTEGQGYFPSNLNPATPPEGTITATLADLPANAEGKSYRFNMLSHQGSAHPIDFDFIGSKVSDWQSPSKADAQYEGYSSYNTKTIISGDNGVLPLPTLLDSGFVPEADIVLITLGINDALDLATYGGTIATQANMTKIINDMRAKNKNLVFLLAKVIPVDTTNSTLFKFGNYDPNETPTLADFTAALTKANNLVGGINDIIDNLAQTLSTSSSPVTAVDMPSVFAPNGVLKTELLADGIHPNDAGEGVMAEAWIDALETFFDGNDTND